MGYACPVCDHPQHDAEHLANHLALTAITHGDDHEAWLDDNAPDWGADSPAELGERVAPHAEEVAHETVFEASTNEAGRPDVAPSGTAGTADPAATREAAEAARRMREAFEEEP
jgi:hypothetical protein